MSHLKWTIKLDNLGLNPKTLKVERVRNDLCGLSSELYICNAVHTLDHLLSIPHDQYHSLSIQHPPLLIPFTFQSNEGIFSILWNLFIGFCLTVKTKLLGVKTWVKESQADTKSVYLCFLYYNGQTHRTGMKIPTSGV